MVSTPNFFRAIGKVKKWYPKGVGTGQYFYGVTGNVLSDTNANALQFYEIVLTQDLDHAIEWLYNLIKE